MIVGFDTLTALRRSGRVPRWVEIETGVPAHRHLVGNVQAMNAAVGDLRWHVVVTPDELLSRLDLRPLQGLQVDVSGVDAGRVQAIAELCKPAASRVVATVVEWDQHGQCRIVWQSDTEGILDYAVAV